MKLTVTLYLRAGMAHRKFPTRHAQQDQKKAHFILSLVGGRGILFLTFALSVGLSDFVWNKQFGRQSQVLISMLFYLLDRNT